jgi:hypothetical protein
MFLLLINSLGNPGKRKVTRCNVHIGQIIGYGKKSTLLRFNKRAQDLGDCPLFDNSEVVTPK